MEESYSIKKGIVVDNDDPKKLGRLKIQILPEFIDIKEDLLPWVSPINSNSTEDKQSFNPLAADTLLWVLVSDDWKSFYWIGEYPQNDKISYDQIITSLSGVTDLTSYDYKDTRMTQYEDGTVMLHNLSDGEKATVHSSGSYTIFKSSGEIITKGDSKVTIKAGAGELANVELNSDGTMKLSGTSITLATGDSILWQPNLLGNCLFTGVSHGGSIAGISNLKGGT